VEYTQFTEALRSLFFWLMPNYLGRAHEGIGDKIKKDGTPVGSLDHLALAELRRVVLEFFPDDRTVGEEDGARAAYSAEGQPEWNLDGLDGTGNRRMGTNSYGGALSRRRGDEVLYAAIFRPVDQALRGNGFFYAERNKGAWQWCEKHGIYHRIHTARENELERPVVMLEGSSKKLFRPPVSELGKVITARPSFSACVATTTVAQGRASALVAVDNAPWDNLPAILFVKEAGGIVTDWNGDPLTFQTCGNIIAAGNAADHRAILQILKGATP